MNLHLARYVDRWLGLPLCLGLHGLARLRGDRVPPLRATTPPRTPPPAAPRRLLGIKFYGLGNIVMILPALRALRRAFPEIEIDFLTLPGNAGLLEQSGLVRRVLTTDVSTLPRFARSLLALAGTLGRGGYDTVLDFEQFLKVSGVFAFLTRAPERIGLDTEGQQRAWLYTTRVAYTDSDHTVDIFLRLVAPLGVRADPDPWHLPIAADERARARALAGLPATAGAPLVVVHLGTGPNRYKIALKRWDADRFAAVADALVERHGVTVVFTGQGDEERALVAEARRAMRRPAVDACDRLDVPALGALLAEARFVLSNDTSVMHLAGAVGTPVVALFGPTSPRLYGPRGARDLVFYKQLFCSPCISNYNLKLSRCTDPVCMRSITVDEVVDAIERAHFASARGAARGG
ncbi:MAG TPA: glycosyltransferase family 9 protein [Candidatus Binatia bacterium]|nr:glycosyltransferase family 9 protein [Candidatus Binatia bacterium]